jgi:hypothetical protein
VIVMDMPMPMSIPMPIPMSTPMPMLLPRQVLYMVLQVPVFLLEFRVFFFSLQRYSVELHRILHIEFHEIPKNFPEVIIWTKMLSSSDV